jgi:pimeloyl-ACP methyl ester carboxylesterase
LQNGYLAKLDIDTLLDGLDYLQKFVLPEKLPAGVKIRFIHGAKDIISPVKERAEFAGADAHVEPNGGHAVFIDYFARHIS